MDWSLMAQMGLQIGSSLFSSSTATNAAKEQQDAENDAIKAYNKQVIAKSAQDISALNVSKSISRMQTTQALFAVQRQSMQEKSTRKTMAAATDTAGASARQALQAVDVAKDQASSMYMLNQEMTETQINANIRNTVGNSKNSLQQLKFGGTEQAAATGMGNTTQLITTMFTKSLES